MLETDVEILNTFKSTVEGYDIPKVKSDLQNLQNQVAGLGSTSTGGTQGQPTTDTQVESRLTSIESDVTDLKSRVSNIENSGGSSSSTDYSQEIQSIQASINQLQTTVDSITSANPTLDANSMANFKYQILTIEEYNALEEPDEMTMYFIVDGD